MMDINELDNLSEQELDTIAKRINAIKCERWQTRIKSLIKHFKDAWCELESAGVEISCNDDFYSGDTLELDSIDFNF